MELLTFTINLLPFTFYHSTTLLHVVTNYLYTYVVIIPSPSSPFIYLMYVNTIANYITKFKIPDVIIGLVRCQIGEKKMTISLTLSTN